MFGLLAFTGHRVFNGEVGTSLKIDANHLFLDTVKHSVFQELIPVTGNIQPIESVLISANEGGQVDEKYVQDGAIVKAGQPLLRLSNPDLQLSYLGQEANIITQMNQIRSNSLHMEQKSLNLHETAINVDHLLGLTRNRMERNESLAEEGIIPRVEAEEMRQEYNNLLRRKELLEKNIRKDSVYFDLQQQQMASTVKLMKRNLDIARNSLDNLTIRAPINGQISGFTAELGAFIPPGLRVAQIDDLSNFKVRVRIDEFYISRVFPSQEGNFVWAGQEYQLKIQRIYPEVSNGVFEVDMIFEGDLPKMLKRGQTINLNLELSGEEEAVLLAKGDFFDVTGGNWVYRLTEDRLSAIKQPVRLGRHNPSYYEVIDGLEPGDLIITSGYQQFGDKDRLLIRN